MFQGLLCRITVCVTQSSLYIQVYVKPPCGIQKLFVQMRPEHMLSILGEFKSECHRRRFDLEDKALGDRFLAALAVLPWSF